MRITSQKLTWSTLIFIAVITGCRNSSHAAEIVSALPRVHNVYIVSGKKDTVYFTQSHKEAKEFTGLFKAHEHNPQSDSFIMKPKRTDGWIFIAYDRKKTLKINFDLNCCYWFEYANDTIAGLFTKRLSEFLVGKLQSGR